MKLKLHTKLFYGIGGLGDGCLYNFMACFGLFFLTTVAGIKPAAAGFIIAFATLWNAACSPLIGYFSDHHTGPLGSRKPFLIVASVPLGVFTALLFISIDAPYTFKLIYYGLMTIFFWVAFATFFVPYLSWGAEITRDYNERTVLRSYTYIFDTAGMVVAMVVPTIVIDYVVSSGHSTQSAWSVVGILLGIFGASAILVSALSIKSSECECTSTKKSKPKQHHKFSLHFIKEIITGYREVMHLKCARFILLASVIYLIASNMSASDRLYYFSYNMHLSGTTISMLMFFMTVAGLLFAPLITHLTKVWDKRTVFFSGMTISGAGCMLFKFTGIAGIPSICIFMVVFGISTAIYWQLMPSLVYDVCEVDELISGTARTGTVVSLQSVSESVAEAFGAQILGIILQLAGFNGESSSQTSLALEWVENSFTFIPGILTVLSALMIFLYPITREVYDSVVSAVNDRNNGIEVDMTHFKKIL